MKLQIKYMVSDRCILLVQSELKKLGLHIINIRLGEIEIEGNLTEDRRLLLKRTLAEAGLQLIEDRRPQIVVKIKAAIDEMLINKDGITKCRISDYLSRIMGYNYIYLSNIFSAQEGKTIEHYILELRIDRIKDLLVNSDLNLKEIAYSLHYCSVAHLSAQFKKRTGTTPSLYKAKYCNSKYPVNSNYAK